MNTKRLDIEFMRILAAFFVIYNHTGMRGFYLFSTFRVTGVIYTLGLFLSIFCKFAVPLFLAIAGALLLGREEAVAVVWRRRVLRIALILVVWSFLYHIYYLRPESIRDIDLLAFFKGMLQNATPFTFWYLYSYIGFLITLPFLRKFAQSLSRREYIYLFVIHFIFFSAVPVLEYVSGKTLYTFAKIAWLDCNIFIYPLLGYFLSTLPEGFWNWKRLALLWAANLLLLCLSTKLAIHDILMTGELTQTFHNTFVLINCATVFVTCQFIFHKLPPHFPTWLARGIRSLGGATLGIYLMHVFFLSSNAADALWNWLYERNVFPYLSSFILCAAVFLLGYIVTIIIKRIPILRRIVE